MANITILGAGGFGIALALMCHDSGHQVSIWSHLEEEAQRLQQQREQKKLLPGVLIPNDIKVSCKLESLWESELAILAVPSFAVRETCKKMKPFIAESTIIACVAKGLEQNTFLDFSQVMKQELPNNANVILSGPSHAEEVATRQATTIVVASDNLNAADKVQDLLMNPQFRVYVNDDVIGVELGGALKNIIAVAAGIAHGLGIGDNARAALMTRGITEIARLGVAMGGRQETFGGLSGIGDLMVTCSSEHSRNRRFGVLIGQGVTVQDALLQVGMVVEGYSCTAIVNELSQKLDVEMPITRQAYEVLYQGKSPEEAIKDLMGRPKRHESESAWLNRK